MTNIPVSYRLTLPTEEGLLKRYIRVDDRMGGYLLTNAHITIVAPNYGLISGNDSKTATSSYKEDSVAEYPDLDSANTAAEALYDAYRKDGWQDDAND